MANLGDNPVVDVLVYGASGDAQYPLPTYSCESSAIAGAANKVFYSILNPIGSGKVIRVWRVWPIVDGNPGTTAVILWEFRKLTAHTGGAAGTIIKYDDDDPNSVADVKIGTSAITPTDANPALYRSFDVQINSYTSPYDQRYEFSEGAPMKPVTLRPGFGLYLKQITNATQPDFRVGAVWTESDK